MFGCAMPMRMNVCVMCVWIWVCVCAHVLCVCTMGSMGTMGVCVCVYCVCVLQEVCYQYWPSGGSQRFGEFTVQLLGQEDQTGFVLRNFTITNSKVWLHTSCIAVFSQHHCCTHIHTLCVQSRETLNVSQFHITNWAPDGSCSNIKTVTDVIDEIIKVQIRTGNRPITIHCRFIGIANCGFDWPCVYVCAVIQ